MRVAVVFVGTIHDQGFNEAAFAGVEAARRQPGRMITVPPAVPFEPDAIRASADTAAREVGPGGLVVLIGGQGDGVAVPLSAEWPDRRFAVVQGSVTGANLSSYHVRQEQSAFLAGVLAAHVTRSGTVAHLSGHRVRPGLLGRAAFVAGVRHAAPGMPVLTGFCGTQDDAAVTLAWARAQLDAGADVLFTMLNGARSGAIDACRAVGAMQIGNVLDWTALEPDVFVASALARIDLAVEAAIAAAETGQREGQSIGFSLDDEAGAGRMVDLVLRPDIEPRARSAVATARAELIAGRLEIAERYDGAEFDLAGRA